MILCRGTSLVSARLYINSLGFLACILLTSSSLQGAHNTVPKPCPLLLSFVFLFCWTMLLTTLVAFSFTSGYVISLQRFSSLSLYDNLGHEINTKFSQGQKFKRNSPRWGEWRQLGTAEHKEVLLLSALLGSWAFLCIIRMKSGCIFHAGTKDFFPIPIFPLFLSLLLCKDWLW